MNVLIVLDCRVYDPDKPFVNLVVMVDWEQVLFLTASGRTIVFL